MRLVVVMALELTPLPYRPNVQMIIFRGDGKILLIDESNEKEILWKFPQGGMEKGENELETVQRELKEEVNITDYTIIREASFRNHYDWIPLMQQAKGFRGNEQTIFLIHATNSQQTKITEKKIISFEWVTFEQALNKFQIPNQIESAKKAWNEFKPIVERKIGK